MTPHRLRILDSELETFVEYLTDDMGRPERRKGVMQNGCDAIFLAPAYFSPLPAE